MILGFKTKFPNGTPTEFIEKIMNCSKKHTIRTDASNRWKKDREIQFATGVRTKNYVHHLSGLCTGTQKIVITHRTGWAGVFIDNKPFGEILHHGLDDIYEYHDCLLTLAKNDGFDSIESFFKWFNKGYKGKIIHWTDFRY